MTEAEINQYLRKKDFYDILGVTKTSTETEIKKAYRKLALKFHPDKNQNPKSKDVFKKVSQAYDCLSNPEKKDFYDRTGNEEPQQHQQHYQQRYSQDIDPDDIFSFFFGGQNPFNQDIYGHGRQRQRNGQQRQPHQANMMGLIQLIPLLLIFLPAIISFFEPTPAYSYYVNDDFIANSKKDPKYVKRIERNIETEYINNLRTNCHYATQNQKRYRQMAEYYSPGSKSYNAYMRNANNIDRSACEKLDSFTREGINLYDYY